MRPRRTGREGRRGSGAHPVRDWLMGVAERWPHRRRRGDTCVWAWLGGQGAGLVPAEAQGRGGVFLWIQPAAGQWAGPGRGGEAGGALPPPPIGNPRERSELERVHPAPSAGLHPGPASVRTAAAAAVTAAAAAALGDPGPAGAAGGGGARALDVPQRGRQREKGGRVGLGWGAAPLLMWRRVGCTPVERGCQGWRVWSWVWGGPRTGPHQVKAWETGVSPQALLYQGPRDRGPGHRTPP